VPSMGVPIGTEAVIVGSLAGGVFVVALLGPPTTGLVVVVEVRVAILPFGSCASQSPPPSQEEE